MGNRSTTIIVVFLLVFVFFMAFFSMKDDSLIMDEVAHLPAGYSYLTQKDMRLNPEHPPLIKDLAAIPLLFIKNINFPSEISEWKNDINGQWGFGYNFLYQKANPVDKMIFWARIPMILILVLLGFYIFKWAKELFGEKVALLALFLFSFSPTFLAHGRLVTTDVGAATGIFIATYYFLKALKNPDKKNIIFAGISFGLAELAKFSVILLIPFFAILSLVWWLAGKSRSWQKSLKIFILILVIGYLLIGLVYQYHVLNYPFSRQVRDNEVFLSVYPDLIKKPILFMADKPILRPYAQYLSGLFMVFNRASSGHTTYFLGEVSNQGWKNYFPIVYLIKEPLTFHILTIISFLSLAWFVNPAPLFSRKSGAGWQDTLPKIKNWISNHFPEFAMLTFIVIYWTTSLISNLNIGVRHLLPVFPFTFILVSTTIISLLKEPFLKFKYAFLGILILWQAISVILIYPHFLAYFNELVGGPDKGYIYTVDSNLDWGQDLKRLEKWVDKTGIEKIYLDYFGGGEAKYYLKEKYSPWHGNWDLKEFPKGNYLAVSATFLQSGRGQAAPGFTQPTGYYLWLNKYKPITKIGYSIFIYYID